MFETIIVGIANGPRGEDIVKFARMLAPSGSLTLLGVYGTIGDDVHDEGARRKTVEHLEHLRDATPAIDAEVIAVDAPDPAQALKKLAIERHADLIVVGAAERATLGRMVLGDVSRAVLLGAPCAVSVVPHGWTTESRPSVIGVAYDASREADAVLAFAEQLATHVAGTVELTYAVESALVSDSWIAEGRTSMQEIQLAAQQTLDAKAEALQVPAISSAALGLPADVLKGLSHRADVLVCGSRGRGPLGRVLLGSTSDWLVHHASCPVIVVPRTHDPEEGATEQAGQETVADRS